MKEKAFSLIVALMAFAGAQAYDFKSGDLCYNITSNTDPCTVAVAQESRDSNYSGLASIVIPATVEHNGKT